MVMVKLKPTMPGEYGVQWRQSYYEDDIRYALSTHGSKIVDEVMSMLSTTDPDSAWSMYDSTGKVRHREVVEILTFEKSDR
jgi:hypothetical protein